MPNKAWVTLKGTVIAEPTNRQTAKNQTVLSLKVAVQTTKKDENSQYPVSDIYDVSVWGATAERLIGRIKTKTKVTVIGDMQMGEPWEDRNHVHHISPRVNASFIEIDSGGVYNANNNNQTSAQPEQSAQQEEPVEQDPNSMPF